MDSYQIVTGVLIDDATDTVSLTQLCETYHIPERFLVQLMEQGVFDTTTAPVKAGHFNASMIKRICSAHRLQNDLGVNIEGVVLVLELLDQMEQLRQELSILKRHVTD